MIMSKAIIHIEGIINEDTTLLDVIRQYKSYENPTEVLAIIRSVGGGSDEGDKIYDYLKALDKEIPVTTDTDKAYSASAKIFSAGRNRIIADSEKPLMIHLPWAKVEGGADKLEIVAEGMREIESEFATFYSEFLDIPQETAFALLENETYISGKEAVEMGFATELKTEMKAVALYKQESEIKKKVMKKSKLEKFGSSVMAAFKAFNEETEVKALVLQDSNATEIDFPDVEDGATPKVGDKAQIDGAAIADGEYIIPSMEESTVVFVEGVITEIKEKVEEEETTEETEETEEEIQARLKKEEKTVVKSEEIKEIAVWEREVINTSFAVGDVVEYEYTWEEETTIYSVGAGEFQLADGRKIVTDASGVIVVIKEADAATTEEDVVVESKLQEKIEDKIMAKFEAKFEAQETEIKALKKLTGSKEININAKETLGIGTKEKKGNRAAEIIMASRK